ncbi:MAG: hypothetical protein CMJ59_22120 [Planctomycetaceae bacterium]|nr:hypothetical protein [Planctomycetaceae bacterium]
MTRMYGVRFLAQPAASIWMTRLHRGNLATRILGIGTFLSIASLCAADDPRVAQFEKGVRPLLVKHCWKCHAADKPRAGLRLDSRGAILAGGEHGPAVVAGNPSGSLLIKAIQYKGPKMPPSGQLPPRAVRQLENWVAAGAVWPRPPPSLSAPDGGAADDDWWAFRPLDKAAPPRLSHDGWSRNPVDKFILRRLRAARIQPAPNADRTTLLRRLHFDLVGLPPLPGEVAAFQQDPSPDAWERRVDRLLASPRYGEHTARYWLDLVRYSDSDGWNQDAYRPSIWRYRDYVIDAFNSDKPYSEFVRQQLAGDEIADDDPQHLDAAGFLRLGIYEYNQRDARGHWNDIMNEITDVVGDVFLGMSIACARCHDHKFDPIPQQDYFRLRAFFEPLIWRDDLPAVTLQAQQQHAQQLAMWIDATAEIRDRIDRLVKPYNDRKWRSTVDKFPLDIQACFNTPVDARSSWEHQMAYLVSRQFLEEGGGPLKNITPDDKHTLQMLEKELSGFDSLKPPSLPPRMTVTDFPGRIAPTVIPSDPQQRSVAPDFLSVLVAGAGGPASAAPIRIRSRRNQDSTGRRTALAAWIGSADNRLSTRVMVNRIWQQHFGQGIVSTPNNFGRMGEQPTHPGLLDWLAVTFVESGWSIKRLHRRLLMSAAWQQSSDHPDAVRHQQQDPDERLLWRARVRRLRAEQIRDAMLSAGDGLWHQLGGPGVEQAVPRRAVYVNMFRNTTETFLHAFDAANGLRSVADRNTTTTPTQSLLLMNGNYALRRAEELADRLLQTRVTDAAALIDYAMRLTWGRGATDTELNRAATFLGVNAKQAATEVPRQQLCDLCHILFNSNEFLYLD